MSSIVCVRDLLMCMQQAGQMYEMQGAFREAEYYYKDALNIARAHGLKGVATQLLLRRADIASRRNEYQTTSDMLAEATLLLGQPHQNLKIEIPTGQALASQIHSGKYEGVAVEANTPSKFGTISLIPSREDLMDTDEDLAQVGSSTTTPIKGGLEPKRCLAGELVDITNTHTFTHRRSSTHTRTSPKGTLPQNVIYDTPSTLTCTASSLTKDGAGDNPALPQMETGQSPVLAQKGAQDSPEPIGNGLEDPPVALPWPVMRTRVDTSLGMAAVYMSCGDMVLKRDNNFQESLRLYRLALKCLTDVREARVGIAVATLQTKLNQARRPPVHAPQQDAQPTYEAHVQVTLELGTHAMHTHDSAEASDRRQMDVGGITQRTHTHTPGEVLVHSTRPRKRVKRSGPGATVNRCGMYSSDSGTRESLNLKKDQSDDRGMTDVQSDCSELCSSQSDDGEGGESESECSQSQRQRVPTPANVLRREDKARVLVRIAWVRFLRVSSGGRRERERCSVCVCTCACTCACAGVWESGCGRVRQTKCGYAPAQRRTQSLHSSIDADGEAHTHTHIHAEAHKQTGTDVAINEQGNTGVGVHNQPTSDTHGHTRVRAHMPAPADSGEEGVCLHRRMSDIVNILRHNVYHIRPGIARTESLYRLGAVMCWAGNAGIPLVDSGLSINSADVLLAEAKGYLKTALNACGSLPAPFLQRRICLKLLQLTNESDAYSRFYYHNRSLAVTFLHQMGHRNHSHSAEVEALDMTCDFGNMSALEWYE
ncbi:hypothetical protein SARC_02306 [Sphaeroforma arctica JP610]|uniref:Uncharacterized protein n=1 Tax=Sphaeroforma arctica JP610 TaxID=667725 RepID=A0A0L0G9B0_9EUKA|nr:hypothetical protein SARC_02306 [Sphaeroforma arctica JP610]KNC85504.1 hypothetical protein SARC_02306 [Sphaeroforma arctica JP610]|eukprot:XP_014159406.1 hypothetical protein SARC_02306 [Sphaeroforma arctica JP610]